MSIISCLLYRLGTFQFYWLLMKSDCKKRSALNHLNRSLQAWGHQLCGINETVPKNCIGFSSTTQLVGSNTNLRRYISMTGTLRLVRINCKIFRLFNLAKDVLWHALLLLLQLRIQAKNKYKQNFRAFSDHKWLNSFILSLSHLLILSLILLLLHNQFHSLIFSK